MKKSTIIKLLALTLLVIASITVYLILIKPKDNKPKREFHLYDIQDNIISEEKVIELTKTIPYVPYLNNVKDAYDGNNVGRLDAIEEIVYNSFIGEGSINVSENNLLEDLNNEYNFYQDNAFTYKVYDSKIVEKYLKKYNLLPEDIENKSILFSIFKIIRLDDQYTLFERTIENYNFIYMLPITLSYTVTHEKDKLIVEEKKLFVVKDGDKYKVYRNTYDAKNDINALVIIEGIDSYTDIMKNDIVRDISNFSKFKSIFKLNDNNEYYWYSTEMIK